jgi:hypothetical protein
VQVRNYINKLETGISGFAAGDGACKDMSELWSMLRIRAL